MDNVLTRVSSVDQRWACLHCNNPLPRRTSKYCNADCYRAHCGQTSFRTCSSSGCTNVSVPGAMSGTRCLACFYAARARRTQRVLCGGAYCLGTRQVLPVLARRFCSEVCAASVGALLVCPAGHQHVARARGEPCLRCAESQGNQKRHPDRKRPHSP
jgi:hypothetical protein